MENEILRRAAAYFVKDAFPKGRCRLAFTAVTEKHRNRRVHGHVRGSLALVASPPSQGSERHRLRRAPLPGRTTTSIPRGVPTTPRPRPSLSPPRARCP